MSAVQTHWTESQDARWKFGSPADPRQVSGNRTHVCSEWAAWACILGLGLLHTHPCGRHFANSKRGAPPMGSSERGRKTSHRSFGPWKRRFRGRFKQRTSNGAAPKRASDQHQPRVYIDAIRNRQSIAVVVKMVFPGGVRTSMLSGLTWKSTKCTVPQSTSDQDVKDTTGYDECNP